MKTIQHRHVFYLSGFDPRGASFYHRVFKEEAKKQSRINHINIEVKARKKHDKYSQGWQIEAQDQGQQVITQYDFLCWDDIIRQYWIKSFWSILLDFFYVCWVYISTGTLKRVAKTSRTPAITGLYPAVYISVSALLATLLWSACIVFFSSLQLTWLGWLLGLALFSTFLYTAKIIGDRLNVFWLLRIYAFTAHWAAGDIEPLQQRISLFADKIVNSLQDKQQDEVIIVSHSVGTMLAVAVAAEVIRKLKQLEQPETVPSLNLITLGECIPLLSLLPKADAIRADLACLSASDKLYWIDYTSPADGACFPLVDPVKVSLPNSQTKNSPQLLSTRFYKLYTEAHYQKIRRNFYKMHFLYLMSHDYLGEYDFFAMITGKLSLTERLKE
jgi:hypothetical protein